MFIRSERLFLRPAWPEDGQELAALFQHERLMSNLPPAGLPDSAAAVCEGVAGEPLLPRFLITLPCAEGTKIIGGIGLARADDDAGDDVALRYWIADSHWGYGYAAEAARAVLRLACALGHRRIIASQRVDDRASLLVLTRGGFRPTGELRVQSDDGGAETHSAIYVAELNGLCAGDPDQDEESAMRAA